MKHPHPRSWDICGERPGEKYGPPKVSRLPNWLRVLRAIGVTLKRNRGHREDGARGQALLQNVVLRLVSASPSRQR
jgi:hypothetical protein